MPQVVPVAFCAHRVYTFSAGEIFNMRHFFIFQLLLNFQHPGYRAFRFAIHPVHLIIALLAMSLAFAVQAQDRNAFAGDWVINPDLSDNTDKQVEQALRTMGQKIDRCWFGCEEDRYRGGPAEQEMYDHLSYDKTLNITLEEPEYVFTYDDGFRRSVYTDGRSQSVSLTGLDEVEDFSMAHWEGRQLLVEARPRDGGFANETYTLTDNGTRLRVEMYILPGSFTEPVTLTRVYDRKPAP